MRRYRWLVSKLLTVACFFLIQSAEAKGPVVIFDSPEAVPVAQYLSSLFAPENETPPGLALVSFPIKTQHMKPGVLDRPLSLQRSVWLAQPVFLIGTDSLSRDWLAKNKAQLHAIQAQGIVVQTPDYASVRELQLSSALPLAPAVMDSAAEQWGLHIYPVLIRTDGKIVQEIDHGS